MSRSVPLWEGKTDDAAIPMLVRLRVFERFGGRCALSGRKIQPGDAWQLDHIKPLILGGRHAEDNLQPVLVDAHKAKTADDVKAKAKADRVRAKHLGIFPPSKARLRSRGFSPSRPSLRTEP
jgi:5-methylcytosine-specific restriction endonuclease McrA